MSPAPHSVGLCSRGRTLEPRALASNRRRLYSGSRGVRNRGLSGGGAASVHCWTRGSCAGDCACGGGRHVQSRHRQLDAPAGVRSSRRDRPPGSTFSMRRASAFTPTTGSMTRVRRSTCRANSCPIRSATPTTSAARGSRWFFNPRINIGAMINTERQDELRLHRPHLAHSALQGVLLRGRVWRRGQHLAVARRTEPRQHRLPLGLPRIGRLRLPVRRALGRYRQCRAHLAREPVHQHQPGPDPGRRADRV